ncbi:hypothetical protein MBLNU457_g0711t1 [Dothideomycetes sp. NU457]
MSLIPLRSLTSGLSRLISTLNPYAPTPTLPALPTTNIETSTTKPSRTLLHLLKANHHAHNIIQHDRPNTLPQLLCSSYLLGATAEDLSALYDDGLEPWVESNETLVEGDWMTRLGKRGYERAFVDFFEDRCAERGYEWREMVGEVFFEEAGNGGRRLGWALFELGAASGVVLALAFETGSQVLGIESLGLAASGWGEMARVGEEEDEVVEGEVGELEVVLERIRADHGLERYKGRSVEELLQDAEAKKLVVEYWKSWSIGDLRKAFEDGQRAATERLFAGEGFDVSSAQVLSASHAVRVLLPIIPADWHTRLLRQWWLLFLSTYVNLGSPNFDTKRITNFELDGRDWRSVTDRALRSKWSTDAQFVTTCRALKVAADTRDDKDQFYLKAGVRFAEDFDGWNEVETK